MNKVDVLMTIEYTTSPISAEFDLKMMKPKVGGVCPGSFLYAFLPALTD